MIVARITLAITFAALAGCLAPARIDRMQHAVGVSLASGRDADAAKVAKRLLSLSDEAYGPADVEAARTRGDLLRTVGSWQRIDWMNELSRESLEDIRRWHGERSTFEAAILEARLDAELCAHRWQDAERTGDDIRDICEGSKASDLRDPCGVAANWRLADNYSSAGSAAKAVDWYLRFLTRRPTEPTDGVRAPMLTQFGRYYTESGHFAESLPYFERCLDGSLNEQAQRRGGKLWSDPDGDVELFELDSAHAFDMQSPRCLEDLIAIHRKLGNADEERRLTQLWTELWRAGPDAEATLRHFVHTAKVAWRIDRSVSNRLHDLGFYYLHKGRIGEAIDVYEEATDLLEHGTSVDPRSGRCGYGALLADELMDLAAAYTLADRHGDAARAYARAESAAASDLHPGHELLLDAIAGQAVAQRQFGSLEESEATWRRYVAIAEQRRGPDHADVAYGLTELASVVASSAGEREARSLRARADGIRTRYAARVSAARREGIPPALLSPASPAN